MRNTPEGRKHADFVIRHEEGRLTDEEKKYIESLERELEEGDGP